MEKSTEVFAALFLSVIGLSHLIQPRAWVAYIIWLRGKGPVGVFVHGIMTLCLGSFLVAFHNVWEGMPVLITLFGWAQVLKGSIYLVAPQVGLNSMARVTPGRAWIMVAGGFFAITLALVFWYIALWRDGHSWGSNHGRTGGNMQSKQWRVSPVLGVRNVRAAAEYYRDILGFTLDPVEGVFQPTADEPGGVYAIVKRQGVWIHFQIRRGDIPPKVRQELEREVYVYMENLDGLYTDLQKRGAVILQEPRLAPHGIRELVVEDLNGFRLTFGEFIP